MELNRRVLSLSREISKVEAHDLGNGFQKEMKVGSNIIGLPVALNCIKISQTLFSAGTEKMC